MFNSWKNFEKLNNLIVKSNQIEQSCLIVDSIKTKSVIQTVPSIVP